MVKKSKPGDWRPCGDFRVLNSVAVADWHTLPYILFEIKDIPMPSRARFFSLAFITKALQPRATLQHFRTWAAVGLPKCGAFFSLRWRWTQTTVFLAVASHSSKYTERKIRQLDFLSHFNLDFRHFWGADNEVANTLSRIDMDFHRESIMQSLQPSNDTNELAPTPPVLYSQYCTASLRRLINWHSVSSSCCRNCWNLYLCKNRFCGWSQIESNSSRAVPTDLPSSSLNASK